MLILVTGQPGSGKTRLAEQLSKKHNLPVVNTDYFRFKPGTWLKKPLNDYSADIKNELKRLNYNCIIEGAYYDHHDPEQARMAVFDDLLTHCSDVIINEIMPLDDLKINILSRHDRRIIWSLNDNYVDREQLTQYMQNNPDVSLSTALENCHMPASMSAPSPAVETPANVVKLLNKVSESYEHINNHLRLFEDKWNRELERRIVNGIDTLMKQERDIRTRTMTRTSNKRKNVNKNTMTEMTTNKRRRQV